MKILIIISYLLVFTIFAACNNSSNEKTQKDSSFTTPMDNTRVQDTGIHNLDTASYDRMPQKLNDSTKL